MTKDMVIWLMDIGSNPKMEAATEQDTFFFQKDYRLMQRNIFIYIYIYDSAMPGSSWMAFLHNLSGF